jgi:hypothetical protein
VEAAERHCSAPESKTAAIEGSGKGIKAGPEPGGGTLLNGPAPPTLGTVQVGSIAAARAPARKAPAPAPAPARA